MKKITSVLLSMICIFACHTAYSQCDVDTTNTTTGFSPNTPAVIQQGVPYSQTVQVYVPSTYSPYTVDSLHIDSLIGVPTGINVTFNPPSGTVFGGSNGAICFTGTTNDTVGPYPLTFYGNIYTDAGPVPFSFLVQFDPTFGYKFRVEAPPTAIFRADSPICASADTVRFVDLTTGYPTHWAWTFTGGSPSGSGLEFPKVVYDSAGTYPVTLIVRNGISSDTITRNITVNPSVTGMVTTIPAVGNATATGAAAVVAAGGTPPFTYLWSNGGMHDSIANVVHGTYAVSVTDLKGCQYVNDTVTVSFINGLLQLEAGLQVKVYPNPATNVLNLVWSQKPDAEISVSDMKGNIVRLFISNNISNLYDIHDLATGAYLIRITDKISRQQRSLVISKQ